jgi:hypothetical protein
MAIDDDGHTEEHLATRTAAAVFGLDPTWPRSV